MFALGLDESDSSEILQPPDRSSAFVVTRSHARQHALSYTGDLHGGNIAQPTPNVMSSKVTMLKIAKGHEPVFAGKGWLHDAKVIMPVETTIRALFRDEVI